MFVSLAAILRASDTFILVRYGRVLQAFRNSVPNVVFPMIATPVPRGGRACTFQRSTRVGSTRENLDLIAKRSNQRRLGKQDIYLVLPLVFRGHIPEINVARAG